MDTTSTFAANLSLPVHRWFRYPAGFSAVWVHEILCREKERGRCRVLDPFAGCGTVLIEAESSRADAMGIEAHPFIARVAAAKLHWREKPSEFRAFALSVLDRAQSIDDDPGPYPQLIQRCYPPEVLKSLDRLKRAWLDAADGSLSSELTWLALASVLRECSPVGTAQWQYILPGKRKARALDPYDAFLLRIWLMSGDMTALQAAHAGRPAILLRGDARDCSAIPPGWADLVITSPPYANNYDYADATRLEMCFFGDVEGWGDLQQAVRRYLVRSCTQHVARDVDDTLRMLQDRRLTPIRDEIQHVCHLLSAERQNHGGKKAYHTMIAAYFLDLARVWMALRRVTARGARVCFVVGDSAPYGIHVPVERWLGELAVAAGFASYTFEKTRDRNVKWRNRKHRVPLQEGRLWVEG
ncbi:MAG: DNA modification methylase [Armatimonadetes bacterium]|nr:DNA modification methylase [Armatimonadota bacterium]